MGCVYPIFEARAEMRHQILCRLTLKHKQILNCELFVFAPTQSQALLPGSGVSCSVEKIVYAFAVNLQER